MGDDPLGIRELLKLSFVVVKRLKWLYCTAGSLIRGICTPLELARRYDIEHVLRHRRLFFITNRCMSGGTCISFFGCREKCRFNQIWNIVIWILLSHLGCWMNKFCVLPGFLGIIFPLRCLVAMHRSLLLICMQIESRTDPVSKFFESHILCRSYWHNAS